MALIGLAQASRSALRPCIALQTACADVFHNAWQLPAADAQGQCRHDGLAEQAGAEAEPGPAHKREGSSLRLAAQEWGSDHARRLAELERASRVRDRALPSAEDVAERLRSHASASCSTAPPAAGPRSTEPLSWQSLVEQLRAGEQQPVERQHILTDTFRCVHIHLTTSPCAQHSDAANDTPLQFSQSVPCS